MKWPDQQRVFRMLPGLENAEFVRLGQIHRNTFINSPKHLAADQRVRKAPRRRRACQTAGRQGLPGRLTVGDERFEVSGHAWFDRQYGDLVPAVKMGWQWFALQMDDDTQIVMFEFNSVPAESRGAIMRGAQQTELGPTEFTVEVLRYFTDPGTGVRSPVEGRAPVGGRRFAVTRLRPNRGMREPAFFPTYWEGDCSVAEEGAGIVGKAYVELQGFKKATA